jgi:hypothetical protein
MIYFKRKYEQPCQGLTSIAKGGAQAAHTHRNHSAKWERKKVMQG